MAHTHSFLQHFDRKNGKTHFRETPALRDFENFSTGDWIKVGFLVQENEKKRLQFFEGKILAMKGPYFEKKVTLRTAGIERIFCCQSPHIQTFTLLKKKTSHRSKLYYLRQRVSKRVFG
uniref:Ribosomal protein L19 n=1 Tax=Pseudochlorodesmis sp. HV01306b TaxID=2358489 RepID=A0A386AYB3_9CHLO|nr:ribosomal protein L19 [Pseudochlorodesmis sp. HV01306b]